MLNGNPLCFISSMLYVLYMIYPAQCRLTCRFQHDQQMCKITDALLPSLPSLPHTETSWSHWMTARNSVQANFSLISLPQQDLDHSPSWSMITAHGCLNFKGDLRTGLWDSLSLPICHFYGLTIQNGLTLLVTSLLLPGLHHKRFSPII